MVANKILEVVAYHSGLGLDEIDQNKSLTEIGLDSLDATEVILHIEDDFGVEINEKEWDKIKSVKDLIATVEEKCKK